MKVNPKPAEPVRMVTTHEGKFLNLDDMIKRLHQDPVLDQALTTLTIGKNQNDHPRRIMANVLADFVFSCGGVKL